MEGRHGHMEPDAAFRWPALSGVGLQQAVMAAHAVAIQIAQKRALLHHPLQGEPLLRRGLR